MPARTLPGLNLRAFYSLGESGWNTTMDEDLRKLSALVPAVVLSRVTSLPDSPANGDIHILTAEDSNSGPAGSIIYYENGAWVYFAPAEGWEYYSIADAGKYRYTGGTWIALGGDSIDALDVTYSSGTTGDSNSTEVNVADALDDLYERVRGVGTSRIVGAFATINAADAAAFASRGGYIRPCQNLEVHGLWFAVPPGSTSETFTVRIAEVASLGANLGTVVAGPTNDAALADSGLQDRFVMFPAPVTLTAGQLYVMVVSRTDGIGTTSAGVRICTSLPLNMVVPAQSYARVDRYSTTTPTTGTASADNGASAPLIAPIVTNPL